MRIRVLVSARNVSGEPDFYPCIVYCTQDQYDNGDHYEAARQQAIDEGYDPFLAYDENDTGLQRILHKFGWTSVPTINC